MKPDVQTEPKTTPGWKPKREAPIPGAAPQGKREPKVRKVQIKGSVKKDLGMLKSALKTSLNKYVPARKAKKSLEVIQDLRGQMGVA